MTTAFCASVWDELGRAAKRSKQSANVAVAYFSQGGAELLPIGWGSRLVVDASEAAVKSGQTCPTELRTLMRRGVRVYSQAGLHAKVFVLGSKAFVGSPNVSGRSANHLQEAMIVTSDRKVVADAKRFIDDMCLQELGPKGVDRLAKMYRPPQIDGGSVGRSKIVKRAARPTAPRIRLVQLVEGSPPEGSEGTWERGRKRAEKRMTHPRRFALEAFWWGRRNSFELGDIVVQVTKVTDGRRLVSPPGTVIQLQNWRRGSRALTFVYTEAPAKRRVSLDRLATKMGRGARQHLSKSGLLSETLSQRLFEAWRDGARR